MVKKFLRQSWSEFSKLGKRKKKKQKWKRPTGRHNKMREKRRGYPLVVRIGYHKISKEKTPFLIRNLKDLSKIKENNIACLGNIGKKKKIEILTKAKERKIEFCNVNIDSFLKKNKIKEKIKEIKK